MFHEIYRKQIKEHGHVQSLTYLSVRTVHDSLFFSLHHLPFSGKQTDNQVFHPKRLYIQETNLHTLHHYMWNKHILKKSYQNIPIISNYLMKMVSNLQFTQDKHQKFSTSLHSSPILYHMLPVQIHRVQIGSGASRSNTIRIQPQGTKKKTGEIWWTGMIP